MATKHKDPAAAGTKETKRGASPMGSGSASGHRIRPRPSSPSGTSVVKDQAKTQGSSKAGDQLSNKHVPNYLKPTISSKTDVGKKLHSHDDMHKTNTTSSSVRRRSFDKPLPASQVHKAVHQSSSGARVAAPSSLKNSVPVVAKTNNNASSSSERVSKVVKAVKTQPPLVKTKSLPKGVVGSSRKEVAVKKASEQIIPNIVKSDAEEEEEEESLDVNVEEELARMENPGEPHDLQPLEKHSDDHVVDDENHHSPLAAEQCAEHNHHDEPEAEAEAENVKVSKEEAGEVHESQNVDETNQQSNGAAIDEASAEDDTQKEKEEEEEEEIMKAHAEVGLTVKTSPDEVAESEEQGKKGEESAKSEPATTSVVHKRQIGGPINKKESPAYNDVIEETASKLVEKRVNKVRALAGAFETVISLEQPHSS